MAKKNELLDEEEQALIQKYRLKNKKNLIKSDLDKIETEHSKSKKKSHLVINDDEYGLVTTKGDNKYYRNRKSPQILVKVNKSGKAIEVNKIN